MGVVEIGPRVWRIESLIGARNLFQYLIAGEEASLIVDTGTSATPRDAIVPAFRHVGLPAEAVRFIVVTHPDLDHQGGLAGLRETFPRALTACGFADRGLVSDPERLLSDRYGAYETEHGLGYTEAEKAWIRERSGSPCSVDVTFAGGEEIDLGGRRLAVLHAPGHSAGHLVLYESASGRMFTSDAVHWRWCPAADGSPALPPTYEDVDPYLETVALIESLAPEELHSGHWPPQTGAGVTAFLAESREFVQALDAAIEERLEAPATLRQLCEHVSVRLGPFGAEPFLLMFAVHGHLRRLLRAGSVCLLDPIERPPRFAGGGESGRQDARLDFGRSAR
jgi:glyoxylase-like metal-dependent hydrolase (beta-lactamase superfamily II)